MIKVFLVISGGNKRSIKSNYVVNYAYATTPTQKTEPQKEEDTLSTAEVLDIVKQEQENFFPAMSRLWRTLRQ